MAAYEINVILHMMQYCKNFIKLFSNIIHLHRVWYIEGKSYMYSFASDKSIVLVNWQKLRNCIILKKSIKNANIFAFILICNKKSKLCVWKYFSFWKGKKNLIFHGFLYFCWLHILFLQFRGMHCITIMAMFKSIE